MSEAGKDDLLALAKSLRGKSVSVEVPRETV